MKESKAVYVRKCDLGNKDRPFYATNIVKDLESLPVPSRYDQKTHDVGCQFDSKKLDNRICTCRYLTPIRRKPEVRYFGSPKQIYAYQGSRSFTDIGVGSVKALQRRKVKKIYLPETFDRGVGSSDVSSSFLQRNKHYRCGSYYENKKTSSKCVGGIFEFNTGCAINEKLSPIVQTISGSTSYKESTFIRNIEIGSSSAVKDLTNTTTQVEKTSMKDVDIKTELQVDEILQPVLIVQKDMKQVVSRRTTERKPVDKTYSSDSLLQHVHNLENSSDEPISRLSVEAEDLMENKLEMEYRNIFSARTASKESKYSSERHTSEIKSTSTLKRRFEALRRGLAKKEDSKKNAVIINKASSQVSGHSRKDVSINSDPPSLEARSFSNTKPSVYSPYVTKYYRGSVTNKDECGSADWSSKVANDDDESQGVKGMFKLWGKKFNLDDENYKRRCTPKPSNASPKKSTKKKTETPKVQIKLNSKPDDIIMDEKREGKKFFFFKKKNKEKPFKSKKGVTTGRCEVRDGLVIKILGNNEYDPGDSEKEPDMEPEHYEEIIRKSWLKKFLTCPNESRHSAKIRWNNKKYSPSSSTVFELIDNIYKDTSDMFRSKSQVTIESSYKSFTKQHHNYVRQNIEAWMIPKTIADRAKIMPVMQPKQEQRTYKSDEGRKDNMEVRISDQKWFIDKSKAFSHKIEVVLHSKNFRKVNKEESSEYLRIDIPKGFFVDSSSDDNRRPTNQSSDEEVYKIVEYETASELKKDKPTCNFNIGDHKQNKIKVTVSVKESKKCDSKVFETTIKKPTSRDVVIQGTKRCDVIGVGIITQRDLNQIRKPILKIQDDFSDEESEHDIHRPHTKKCEFAESYLQEYYRHWTPLGIDLYSWCVSDSQLKCCSEPSRSSYVYPGVVTKSCPNIFNDFQTSTIVSSCGRPSFKCLFTKQDTSNPDPSSKSKSKSKKKNGNNGNNEKNVKPAGARVLPKDSIEVFKARKMYALSMKAKWGSPSIDLEHRAPSDCEPISARNEESNSGRNSLDSECPKLMKPCCGDMKSKRKNAFKKHVSMPDKEEMNEMLAKQLGGALPESILQFKGHKSTPPPPCEKHATVKNDSAAHICPTPLPPCLIKLCPPTPCPPKTPTSPCPPCIPCPSKSLSPSKPCPSFPTPNEKPPSCPATPPNCEEPPSCPTSPRSSKKLPSCPQTPSPSRKPTKIRRKPRSPPTCPPSPPKPRLCPPRSPPRPKSPPTCPPTPANPRSRPRTPPFCPLTAPTCLPTLPCPRTPPPCPNKPTCCPPKSPCCGSAVNNPPCCLNVLNEPPCCTSAPKKPPPYTQAFEKPLICLTSPQGQLSPQSTHFHPTRSSDPPAVERVSSFTPCPHIHHVSCPPKQSLPSPPPESCCCPPRSTPPCSSPPCPYSKSPPSGALPLSTHRPPPTHSHSPPCQSPICTMRPLQYLHNQSNYPTTCPSHQPCYKSLGSPLPWCQKCNAKVKSTPTPAGAESFSKALECQQPSVSSISCTALNPDAPLYYSPIHPCPAKNNTEPEPKKRGRCRTSPCKSDDDDLWPTKDEILNELSNASSNQSHGRCKRDCEMLPKMSCETITSSKSKIKHECRPSCPNYGGSPRLPCFSNMPEMQCPPPPCIPPLPAESSKASPNLYPSKSKSKLPGLHLKMLPAPNKKSMCSSECLAWDTQKQHDDCISINSKEKITIRLKKDTPSTEEIRDGYNIKVQDEDGMTLFERKDYRLQHADIKRRPSLVGEMYKASEVRRITTNNSDQAIGADKNKLKEIKEVKSEASIANLIEIQFKLKVTQGDNITKLDISNNGEKDDEKNNEHKETRKKSHEIFVVKNEPPAGHSDQNNDINIRIVIKNFKPKSEKKRSVDLSDDYNDFSKKISAKFHTVSTGYSDLLHDDHVFSVHRATVDLTSSVENSKMIDNNRSVEKIRKPVNELGGIILMGSRCKCAPLDMEDKSDDTEVKSCPSRKYSTSKQEETDTQLTDHKYEYNEDTDTEKLIKYDTEETDTDRQVDPPKYDTEETDTEKHADKKYYILSTTDTDEPDTLPEIKKSLSLDELIKPQTKDEKKQLLKEVFEKVHDPKFKNKTRMRKLRDMLKVILTSDSSDHDDTKLPTNELATDVTYASLKPNYFRDSDSMNNYYRVESNPVLPEAPINMQVVYPTMENNSECSNNSVHSVEVLSSETESAKRGCMCSTLAERLRLASRIEEGGGCCCSAPRQINKKNVETICDLKRESDYLMQINNKTTEFIDIQTQNSRYLTSKLNSTNLSVHDNIGPTIVDSFKVEVKADSTVLNIDSKQFNTRKTCSPERYHLRQCEMSKRNRNAILSLAGEDKIVYSTRLPIGNNSVKNEKKDPLTRMVASDILQSYETKKAVLEIYTEKTISDDGEHLVAKLPKFVYDREQEIQANYEAMATNTYKAVCKKNVVMMAIKR